MCNKTKKTQAPQYRESMECRPLFLFTSLFLGRALHLLGQRVYFVSSLSVCSREKGGENREGGEHCQRSVDPTHLHFPLLILSPRRFAPPIHFFLVGHLICFYRLKNKSPLESSRQGRVADKITDRFGREGRHFCEIVSKRCVHFYSGPAPAVKEEKLPQSASALGTDDNAH